MASQQASQEVAQHFYTRIVEPIDLRYNNQGRPGEANWDLPSKEHPTAYLRNAFTIDVLGEVDQKVAVLEKMVVAFELSLSPRSFGWKDAHVLVGIKLNDDGKYCFMSVQRQIGEMKPNDVKTWITTSFHVHEHHTGCEKGRKIGFHLQDATAKIIKGGLTLHQARIEQLGSSSWD